MCNDELSSLLIICVEVLSNLISNNHMHGLVHGLTMAKEAPSITHLFFANDKETILQIPIVQPEEDNVIIWMGRNNRVYLVRTGYHWFQKLKGIKKLESSIHKECTIV